jgi:hypothetical protein
LSKQPQSPAGAAAGCRRRAQHRLLRLSRRAGNGRRNVAGHTRCGDARREAGAERKRDIRRHLTRIGHIGQGVERAVVIGSVTATEQRAGETTADTRDKAADRAR